MNQSQIHLALTHFPVILSLTGLVVLCFSMVKKNLVGTRISFYILFAAGLFALPVFFSGEGTEEIVERLPGVSESIIERHEEMAKISIILIIATSLFALAGLYFSRKPYKPIVGFLVIGLALASSAFLGITAHLGGQIRHTEIRSDMTASIGEDHNLPINESSGIDTQTEKKTQEDDD